MKKYALISVFDKDGIEDLGKSLNKAGYALLSTGSTGKKLQDLGFEVTFVEKLTGQKELFDGRVKTLNGNIHAAILARRDNEKDMQELRDEIGYSIDVVVVNLYPFDKAVREGWDPERCVEMIDIGGPTMLRSAAKNYKWVCVVPQQRLYAELVEEIEQHGEITPDFRQRMMVETFAYTNHYDLQINRYFEETYAVRSLEKDVLRYGENPHQEAFIQHSHAPESWQSAKILQGKKMSYNNYLDADGAWGAVKDLPENSVVIVKHTNPCGAAIPNQKRQTLKDIYSAAHSCDPISSFGGIVAINGILDGETATEIKKIFYEIIIADGFTDEAREVLRKKKNLRLVEFSNYKPSKWISRSLSNGDLLCQSQDLGNFEINAGEQDVSEEEVSDINFAWAMVKHIKSNAISLVKDGMLIGVGAGQMSRLESAKIAVSPKGDHSTEGAVAGSDAFFPFSDGVEMLQKAGIKTVVQPGGSKNDPEVLEYAKNNGVKMVLTRRRSFKH